MSTIFISHRSSDRAVAAEIRAWLESEGHRSVFLDFDPSDGIPAGRDWEQEIYKQLRMCRAVIVLCSQESMRSKWVFAEITHARALGKFIVPLKIGDCTIDRLISDRQVIDMTSDRDDAYRRLRAGLLTAGIDPDDTFDWDGHRPPFPGLLPFHEEDAAVYFGRSDEITEALSLMNRIRRQNAGEFAIVLGASGAGKSSLVRAGLVPRLRRDPERWLVIDPFRPRDEPTRELSFALSSGLGNVGDAQDWRAIRARLDDTNGRSTTTGTNPIAEIARDMLTQSRHPDARVLLVIDQFEELLGYAPSDPATRLLIMLRDAATQEHSPIVVLATMRSDFLGAFQNSDVLTRVGYQSLTVGPLTTDAIMRVIEQPAAIAGIELESGLASLLVADTETADALPLLAFALRELYEEYSTDGRLDVSDYVDGLGGLHGAIAKVADELIESERLDAAQFDLLRKSFLTMVRLTDDERWAKQVARWDDLPESIRPLLDRFVDARLLISGDGLDGNTIEVAHEALFRSWGILSEWLDDNRAALRLQADIKRAATTWAEEEQAPDYLWRGTRLSHAIELRDADDLAFEAIDRDFIEASESVQTSIAMLEAKRRRRRMRFAGTIAVGTSALALVALFMFVRANDQTRIAEHQTAIAIAEAARADDSAVIALSRQADALISTDPALAAGVAAEAMARFPSAETERVVVKANAALRGTHLVMDVKDHSGAVLDVSFSDDDTRFATSSTDRLAKVWDTDSGDLVVTLEGHTSAVLGVAFNDDGSRIATASGDGTARVWDATSGATQLVLNHHSNPVLDVAFSPDGETIATSSGDSTAMVIDAGSGEVLATLVGHDSPVWSVAFDSDGSRIVTAGGDGTARVWDAETGEQLAVLSGHQAVVLSAAFSPDGTALVTASVDGTAKVWDLATGVDVTTFTGHTDSVRGVAFKSDGTSVVSISNDGTALVWEPSTGQVLLTLTGHTGLVRGVAFSNDGTTIATASTDQTAKLWDASTGEELAILFESGDPSRAVSFSHSGETIVTANGAGDATIWDSVALDKIGDLAGHEESIWDIAFSPDDSAIATASADGTARLWNATTREPLVTFAGHGGQVRSVAFSNDGTWVVTASDDGTAKLWDVATGDVRLTLIGHDSPVRRVAVNDDDTRIATASGDNTAKIWDVATGQVIHSLAGHTDSVTSVAFSNDGSRVATASGDGTVKVWDTETGHELVTLIGHRGWILDVAFNAEDTRVATASGDGTVRIWDLLTGEELGSLKGHTGPVWAVTYDTPGSRMATAGDDGSTRVWTTDPGDSCELIDLLVTTGELVDALGGTDPIACTKLRN